MTQFNFNPVRIRWNGKTSTQTSTQLIMEQEIETVEHECYVCGYHVYKDVWDATIDEELHAIEWQRQLYWPPRWQSMVSPMTAVQRNQGDLHDVGQTESSVAKPLSKL